MKYQTSGKFKIGQKVYLLKKTIWGDLTEVMSRGPEANKPKVQNGHYIGWVLDYTEMDNQKTVVVTYTQTQQTGGDYFAESDLQLFDEMDFIDRELFEI